MSGTPSRGAATFNLLDLLGAALDGLTARPLRTLLLGVGPALGVAAVVGIIGISESGRGDLREALEALGASLLVVEPSAGSGTGADEPRLPEAAAERARALASVHESAPLNLLTDQTSRRSLLVGGNDPPGGPVSATEPSLQDVLNLRLQWGRFLNAFDSDSAAPAAVLGATAAEALGFLQGEQRLIYISGQPFSVVGVLEPTVLAPQINEAILVTRAASTLYLNEPTAPTQLLVRAREGSARDVARALPDAITYGAGSRPLVRIPTDLLAARAEVDTVFQAIVLLLGLLSLLIGALGITNVMTISVLQRASEIGIRRSMGHSRTAIAAQFLLEAGVIGLTGGAIGGVLGVAIVGLTVWFQGWTLVLNPLLPLTAAAAAALVATIAGMYPAYRAAALEPLETLRLA